MEDNKIQQLEKRIDELEQVIRSQYMAPELDPRFVRTLSQSLTTTSSKTAASATQSVNEAGTSSYTVMYPPSGFIRLGDFNIPYIT